MSGLKLVKRGDSPCYQIVGTLNGQRIRKSTGTSIKVDAEYQLEELIVNNREVRMRGNVKDATFHQVAGIHLSMITKKTADRDSEYADKLMPYISESMMSNLTRPKEQYINSPAAPLNAYVLKRAADGVLASTVNKELSFINTMANKAITEYDLLSSKVWTNIRLLDDSEVKRYGFKEPTKKLHLLPEWEKMLLDELPQTLADMALFSIHTGQRESVVCNLKWEWFNNDVDNRVFYFLVPAEYMKSGVEAYVVLNHTALEAVSRYNDGDAECADEYVFTIAGERVNKINAYAYQYARSEAAKVYPSIAKTDVHSFKRTFVTRLQDAGVPYDWVQRLANHKLPEVTERYNIMNADKRRIMYDYLQRLNTTQPTKLRRVV